MAEGYWAIRTYKAGRIGEKIKYWVPGKKPTRSGRRLKSDLAKIKRNDADAVRRVARLINENFPGKAGCLVRLSYTEEEHCVLLEEALRESGSEDGVRDSVWELAHHRLQLFLRRLRRACQAAGIELKYIAFTSDSAPDGTPVRVHHHLILDPEAAELVRNGIQAEGRKLRHLWTDGQTHCKQLWDEADHTGLAAYLMDQVRRIGEAKKYVPSRNLTVPQPVDRIAPSANEVQPPRGATILHRAEYGPGRPMYIRYVLPEKPPEKHTEKAGPTAGRG